MNEGVRFISAPSTLLYLVMLMVMTSQNFKTGSAQWLRDRNRAIKDKSGFSTEELAYLDITGNQGQGNENRDRYLIDTQPMDKNTAQKKNKIDIRERNEAGGK